MQYFLQVPKHSRKRHEGRIPISVLQTGGNAERKGLASVHPADNIEEMNLSRGFLGSRFQLINTIHFTIGFFRCYTLFLAAII